MASEEISQRWECGDCGGDLRQTDFEATDASATTSYECVDCGAEGDVHRSHDPRSPQCYGCVVPK